MNRSTCKLVVMVMLSTAVLGALEPGSAENALAEAQAMAAEHRFEAVFTTLEPYLQETLDDEVAWEIAAELGRAAFHTARYQQALAILRKVVATRPVVIEPALYLGATSYILGDRAQALVVLEAVLQSGTIDLYRAVTLPGERRFLADPEVRQLLERYSQPLVVDVLKGACFGITLGTPRSTVVERLGADTIEAGSIAARAGPRLIWVWSFDAENNLSEVVLHTDNLWRYTPYRLQIGDSITWNATPSEVLATFAQPQRSIPGNDNTLALGWNFGDTGLDLVFRRPEGEGEEPGRLEIVRLFKLPPGGTTGP